MKSIIAVLWLLVTVSISSSREKVDLLVDGGTIVTMDSSRSILENGAIAVRDERILDIGSSA